MSADLGNPDDATLALARRVHRLLEGTRAALTSPAAAAAPPVSVRRLIAYAENPDPAADPVVADLIAQDERVGRDFRAILKRVAPIYFPMAAAAATAELIAERAAGGHRIRFEPSRAEPAQTYVIIELAPGAPPPEALFVCRAFRTRKLALPPARGGIVQFLLANADEALAALRDPEAEVFLR